MNRSEGMKGREHHSRERRHKIGILCVNEAEDGLILYIDSNLDDEIVKLNLLEAIQLRNLISQWANEQRTKANRSRSRTINSESK